MLYRHRASVENRGIVKIEMESTAYLEMIDLIAAGASSRQIADYHPSAAAQQRASDLLAKAKDGTITPDEQSELDDFVEVEKVLSLAKARARRFLAEAG